MNSSFYKGLLTHALCKYDVFLFGFLGSVIKPLYFPASDILGDLAFFLAFASGYFVRPLGALFFSHIGDKQGRKKAFLLSVSFLILPLFIMTFLPGYATIGIAAPITLLLCRMLQGFGSGGESSGIAVYSLEMSKEKSMGYSSGLVCSVGFIGIGLGTLTASFMTLSFMPEWAWRLCFFIGGVLTTYSYMMRRKMLESPEFSCLKEKKKTLSVPFMHLMRDHKTKILTVGLLKSCSYSFLYFTTIYMHTLYGEYFNVSSSMSLMISTSVVTLWAVFTAYGGRFSDYVGPLRFCQYTLWGLIGVVSLSLICIFTHFTLEYLVIIHFILSGFGALVFSAIPPFFKLIFPTNIRYTGTALSNTVAQATIGSMAPVYASLVVTEMGNPASSLLVLIGATLLGCAGLWLSKKQIAPDHNGSVISTTALPA